MRAPFESRFTVLVNRQTVTLEMCLAIFEEHFCLVFTTSLQYNVTEVNILNKQLPATLDKMFLVQNNVLRQKHCVLRKEKLFVQCKPLEFAQSKNF